MTEKPLLKKERGFLQHLSGALERNRNYEYQKIKIADYYYCSRLGARYSILLPHVHT